MFLLTVFVHFAASPFRRADYIARKESRWDQRCVGVEGMLRHNLLAYTIQPVPYPGRVDFASAFLSRERIVADNIKFGEFEHVFFMLYCYITCSQAVLRSVGGAKIKAISSKQHKSCSCCVHCFPYIVNH